MDGLKEYIPLLEDLLKQGFQAFSEEESNEFLDLLNEDKQIYMDLLNSLENDNFSLDELFNANSEGLLMKLIEKMQSNTKLQEKIQEIFLKRALREV